MVEPSVPMHNMETARDDEIPGAGIKIEREISSVENSTWDTYALGTSPEARSGLRADSATVQSLRYPLNSRRLTASLVKALELPTTGSAAQL